MTHKTLRRTVTVKGTAAAPVHIWIVTSTEPDQRQAVISQRNSRLSNCRVSTYAGGLEARLVWENMSDLDGNETGITVRQSYTLPARSEFLLIKTHIVNGADAITRISLGMSDLSLGADPDLETLAAPVGGMGHKWLNPRSSFGEKTKNLCIPPTAPAGLVCGWLDLSAEKYAFGTGYLNRRGIDVIGEAGFGTTTISLAWRMFQLRGGWSFMEKINGPDQVYVLMPGEEFSTDEWFPGLHSGDWHGVTYCRRVLLPNRCQDPKGLQLPVMRRRRSLPSSQLTANIWVTPRWKHTTIERHWTKDKQDMWYLHKY